MAYIGRGTDKINNVELLDNITFTDSAGPYNITKDTVAFVPVSPQSLVIAIDVVVQSPSSYSFSESSISIFLFLLILLFKFLFLLFKALCVINHYISCIIVM